jgi:hypothetical protein
VVLLAAEEHLGRQFLDRHLIDHHGYGTGSPGRAFNYYPNPADHTNESNNFWHTAEHELMADNNDEAWGEGQVPHHHSGERIHFH